MTFEEWFEENFPAGYTKDGTHDIIGMKKYLKQAWEEAQHWGYVEGCRDTRYVARQVYGVNK